MKASDHKHIELQHADGRRMRGSFTSIRKKTDIAVTRLQEIKDGIRHSANGWGLPGWVKSKAQNKHEVRTIYDENSSPIQGTVPELAKLTGLTESSIYSLLAQPEKIQMAGYGGTPDWPERKQQSIDNKTESITLYDEAGNEWIGTRYTALSELGIDCYENVSAVVRRDTLFVNGSDSKWGATPKWFDKYERRERTRAAKHRIKSPDGNRFTVTVKEMETVHGLSRSWYGYRRHLPNKPDRKGWVYIQPV